MKTTIRLKQILGVPRGATHEIIGLGEDGFMYRYDGFERDWSPERVP
jgi:hypothetical protein